MKNKTSLAFFMPTTFYPYSNPSYLPLFLNPIISLQTKPLLWCRIVMHFSTFLGSNSIKYGKHFIRLHLQLRFMKHQHTYKNFQ